MVKDITKDYFLKNVYDYENMSEDDPELKFIGDKPVLLDFHAKWCGPCRVLDPIMKELDEDYDGKIDIYKVDIEDEMELAQTFGVMAVPTILYIPKEGKPTLSPGAPSKGMISNMIDKVLLNKIDKVPEETENELERKKSIYERAQESLGAFLESKNNENKDEDKK